MEPGRGDASVGMRADDGTRPHAVVVPGAGASVGQAFCTVIVQAASPTRSKCVTG